VNTVLSMVQIDCIMNRASQTLTASYDNNGNFTNVTIGRVPKDYVYHPGTNKVRNTNGSQADDYGYDPNANTTLSMPKGSLGLLYDPFKQLTSFINEDNGNYMSFQYGDNKQRVLMREQVGESPVPNATMYIHGMPARHTSPFGGNDYPLTEKYNEHSNIQDRMYIYGPTGLLAMVQDGISFYFIKDHLGSVRAVMNSSNALSSLYHYTPFGDSWATVLNRPSDYQFTGQELDEFSNGFSLHNFRARLYDSDLGRFYAMDPARQGWSPFVYAGNNPVAFVDKDGRIWWIPIAMAFVTSYASNIVRTGEWGWSSIEAGLKSAFIAGVGVGVGFGTTFLGQQVFGFSEGLSSVLASALGSFSSSSISPSGRFGGLVGLASGTVSGLVGFSYNIEDAGFEELLLGESGRRYL